jgi:methionyl aminopeptidase
MVASPAIKIKNAVDYIEESCRIVVEAIELVGKHIKPGIQTSELDAIAEDFIASKGAEPSFKGYKVKNLVYQYTLCISVNDEVVHGLPGKYVLQEGDIVSIDCGAYKNGYHGDSAYTFAVGEISEEKKKLLQVTQEALMLGVEQATGKNKVYHISGAIQRHVEKHHFSLVRELVGHGVGESLHEDPSIPNFIPPLLHREQYPNVRLKAGQALAIEPMVNAGKYQVKTDADGWTIRTADGKPSAHFEHTVIVQEKAPPIILTLPN